LITTWCGGSSSRGVGGNFRLGNVSQLDFWRLAQRGTAYLPAGRDLLLGLNPAAWLMRNPASSFVFSASPAAGKQFAWRGRGIGRIASEGWKSASSSALARGSRRWFLRVASRVAHFESSLAREKKSAAEDTDCFLGWRCLPDAWTRSRHESHGRLTVPSSLSPGTPGDAWIIIRDKVISATSLRCHHLSPSSQMTLPPPPPHTRPPRTRPAVSVNCRQSCWASMPMGCSTVLPAFLMLCHLSPGIRCERVEPAPGRQRHLLHCWRGW
jgi:hypothetical protein